VQVNSEISDEGSRNEGQFQISKRLPGACTSSEPCQMYQDGLPLFNDEGLHTKWEVVRIHSRCDVLTVEILAGALVQLHPAERINDVWLRVDPLVKMRAVSLTTDLLITLGFRMATVQIQQVSLTVPSGIVY